MCPKTRKLARYASSVDVEFQLRRVWRMIWEVHACVAISVNLCAPFAD